MDSDMHVNYTYVGCNQCRNNWDVGYSSYKRLTLSHVHVSVCSKFWTFLDCVAIEWLQLLRVCCSLVSTRFFFQTIFLYKNLQEPGTTPKMSTSTTPLPVSKSIVDIEVEGVDGMLPPKLCSCRSMRLSLGIDLGKKKNLTCTFDTNKACNLIEPWKNESWRGKDWCNMCF